MHMFLIFLEMTRIGLKIQFQTSVYISCNTTLVASNIVTKKSSCKEKRTQFVLLIQRSSRSKGTKCVDISRVNVTEKRSYEKKYVRKKMLKVNYAYIKIICITLVKLI